MGLQRLMYCYGVIAHGSIDAEMLTSLVGLDKSQVYLVHCKGVCAVVSEVTAAEFSQQSIDVKVKDIAWLEVNAPIHEGIVNEMMRKTAILPMKFCTIFKTQQHVENMLERKYADITYFLHHMQGKVEMSLKVYSDFTKIRKQVQVQSVDVQDLERKAKSTTQGQAYFILQKVEMLLKSTVYKNVVGFKKTILSSLHEMDIEIKKNDVMARKITGKERGIEMVLNLAVLIHTKKIQALGTLVGELGITLPLCTFELTGPFAPYNFIH
jgi:hypothetical protein